MKKVRHRVGKKKPFVPASHVGRLHRALGIPEGQKIPRKRLRQAKHSANPHMRQMANHAINMQKGKHAD
jgi:hypothetical protein